MKQQSPERQHPAAAQLSRPPYGQSIDAVTVYQPWASLIAEGFKKFEFREEHSTRRAIRLVGKRLAIHAAARPVRRDEIMNLIGLLTSNRWREAGIVEVGKALDLLEMFFDAPEFVVRSAVLCTCRLGSPLAGPELAEALGVSLVGRDWTNWGWPLSEVRKLSPWIPAVGTRGFWKWLPPADLDQAQPAKDDQQP